MDVYKRTDFFYGLVCGLSLCVFLWLPACENDSAEIKGTITGAPTVPRVIKVRSYKDSLEINWQPPETPGESEIIRYEYDLNGLNDWKNMGTRPPYLVENVSRDHVYMIRVRAINSNGEGLVSRGVFAKPSNTDAYSNTYISRRCSRRGRRTGKRSSPFVVCTYEDLKAIHDYFRKDGETLKDVYIDINDHIDATPSYQEGEENCVPFDGTNAASLSTCRGWKPLPTLTNVHINGSNHIILGLYSSYQDLEDMGFISYMTKGSTIDNLHLRQVFITGSDVSSHVGGIAGRLSNNSMISNSSVAGGWIVSEGGVVGGIAGKLNNSFLFNVYATENHNTTFDIEGRMVGGIVGSMEQSSVLSAVSQARITAITDSSSAVYGGGIVGRIADESSLRYSLALSTVKSDEFSGSVLGFAKESSTIKQNIGTGKVTGAKAGGFSGGMDGSTKNSNNFWDRQTTNYTIDSYLASTQGLTTAQLKTSCQDNESDTETNDDTVSTTHTDTETDEDTTSSSSTVGSNSPMCNDSSGINQDAFQLTSNTYPQPTFCIKFCTIGFKSKDPTFKNNRKILDIQPILRSFVR
ncbi:MAG: fibronectin type III domain-containing protein [Proteobacteria bacterium]|nr:fibronectin type III domain-containing protein [Pseudomonadota bacterium]